MLLIDLHERVNVSFPGSNRVVDFRDPAAKLSPSNTHIVLTKDGGALIYNYANGNKIEWNYKDGNGEGIYKIAARAMDTDLQTDISGIRLTNNGGILISIHRDNGTWTGNRNRFSTDLRPVAERLLDLGIATPRTPIYVGNWARRDEEGELIGSVAQIVKAPSMPNRIMLYHGTTNARYIEIMKTGLVALDTDARVWNGDKKDRMPEHRADSVYLTASMNQAEYYAGKAVKVDRKRLSWNYRWNMEEKINKLHRTAVMQRDYRNEAGLEETRAKIEKMKAAKELLHRMSDTIAKVEPVILGVELTRADYKYLMADDDYINKWKGRGRDVDPTDWRDSLSDFGQVAYRGRIDPSRIKRLK